MSEMIVQVRNKMLRRIGGVNHFVSHNKDYTIQFQFDESWDNVRTKMAVFAYEDGEYGSEIFDGDTCKVPELPREGRILIGVKAGEDLSTELLCIPVCKSADDVITDEYDEPDPKIYEQILDIINNLWNGGTTVYPSPVKFLASPSVAKVGDLIRVKDVDENGDVTRTEGFDVGVELEKKINAPQVAQVGEVLTVEEVDADGKPKKWKTQTVETAPPDWMENDSNNPGFVKNRTHYKQIMAGSMGNPGYKVNLLDGTHRAGDIILLQSGTTNSLQKFLMRGINSPDWDVYELCMLIKETDNNDKTYNLELICKDRENIVEVNTLSEGNIKVLYSEQKKAFLAYYFISNLSTLSTDDKTKFTQTGVYVQLVGKDYSEYAEIWATYRLYLYSKLSNKYLNIRQDPPDWNENDPTKPGYIKNRTHYDSRHVVELFNTTVENTSLPFIKVADADIDVTKIDRFKMNVQIPALDGSVRTIEFDSDGGEITQYDVNGDGSHIDTIIKKTTGNVTEQYILPYFKTNEVADECTETTGIYTAGLYMLSDSKIIKGTFVGFGNAGELKTIDSKYIELPYIINSEENAKIDMNPPCKLIEGETYIAKYKQNYQDYEIELVAKYCESLGAIGVFSDDDLKTPNQNRFYVTDKEVYVNNSWKSYTYGTFMGLYRYGIKYSIPINAIENLSERLNQKEWSRLKIERLTSDVSTYTFDSPYNLKRAFITIASSGSEANSSNNYSWITVGNYTLTGTYNIATTANTTKYVSCYVELINDLIFGIMSSGNELTRNTDINMGVVFTSSKIINRIRIYTTSGVIGANSTITIYGVRE